MQSTLNPTSSSHRILFPWKHTKTPLFISKKNKFISQKTLSFTTNSLEEPEESLNTGPEFAGPKKLPVVVRGSGRISRYFWDGSCLELVSVDGGASSFCFDFDDGFRTLFGICSLTVRDFFIPKQVNGNYLGYVKWKFLHRVFSSALQVLATQAMLRAIGIGYSRSMPAAASLNWVLKDGLGRFCRCIYTSSLASAFDTNLKRVRFSTSVLFSLSIGVELLTPVFPQYFLLLGSLANIAKQISLACYLATGDRLEIILDTWIESRHVPSPAEVSEEEGIVFPWSKGKELWPIRIGCLNPKGQIPSLSMMAMQSLSVEDYYFICIEMFDKGLTRSGQLGILLCLREGNSTTDIIVGLLQACYVRKALRFSRRWVKMAIAADASNMVLSEWFKLIEDSKRCALGDLPFLNEQMLGSGWAMKNVLLSAQEQARYSFVDE